MKALCAVDGSPFAQWGVEALAALAGLRPERMGLLHVIDITPARARKGRRYEGLRHALSTAEREANHLLRRTCEIAEGALSQSSTAPRTRMRLIVAQGPAAETIVRQANKERADVIVLGTRGLSDVRGFLLGSVARKVVSLASRPVLIVKRPLSELRHVVVAVDGSQHSEAARRFLREHLLPESAHVTVLAIAQPIVDVLAASVLPLTHLARLSKPVEDEARQLVAKCRAEFLREGFEVTTDVVSGHPVLSILQYLERAHADLVVMGSRGLTGTERLVLGSVSEGVLQHAPCAVLIVPGKARKR